MKKKCKVVMLPANEKTAIVQESYLHNKRLVLGRVLSIGDKSFHLYILSDDEIKKGDWIFIAGKIAKASKINCSKQAFKKCIASTDPSLNLPKPSNEFIKKYCEKDGIGEVMVKYVVGHDYCEICPYVIRYNDSKYTNCLGLAHGLNKCPKLLTVAPDNTIPIYSIKESWNREEVKSLFESFINDIKSNQASLQFLTQVKNEWLKQNL